MTPSDLTSPSCSATATAIVSAWTSRPTNFIFSSASDSQHNPRTANRGQQEIQQDILTADRRGGTPEKDTAMQYLPGGGESRPRPRDLRVHDPPIHQATDGSGAYGNNSFFSLKQLRALLAARVVSCSNGTSPGEKLPQERITVPWKSASKSARNP